METSLIEFMTKGLDLPQMDPKAYSPLEMCIRDRDISIR